MYDFEGWATKNDLRCADGLTIRKNAFAINDGKKVPLFWNHKHDTVDAVLGHAILENREEGVYARCSFNDTESGRKAKIALNHGDVDSLSIWANNVECIGKEVIHGIIREVSLVPAGANPGAMVESVVAHGISMMEDDEECFIYTGENIITHSESEASKKKDKDDDPEDKTPKKNTGDDDSEDTAGDEETVKDVFDTLTDKQKSAVAIVVSQAIADAKKGESDKKEEEDDKTMKHNLFDSGSKGGAVISHDDMKTLLVSAKRLGSLKAAVLEDAQNGGVISHALDTTGMTIPTGTQTYGFNDANMLFPDSRTVTATPEWISRNMDWVSKVMSKVHRTPFARVKSVYANITEDEARARGYIKGKQKKTEVFTTLKRATEPQTVYKLQNMDRDDIIDIVDFDVVVWIKAEMRKMLDEEIARAILIGDGRSDDADDKIQELHVRPVAKDVPLFNTVVKVTVPSNASEDDIAKETIRAIIKARKDYKGSGVPDFWTTNEAITGMLLLEDQIGHSIYKTDAELATKLRVNEIIPVEPMENTTITISGTQYPLIGVVTNLNDYNVGADRGGEVSMFDDFDLDFNRQKYLIETRFSGALIKPFSALTIVLDKGGAAG